MTNSGLDRESEDRTATILGERLSPVELRSAIKELDPSTRSGKSVERIVAETENQGRLLRTRVADQQLPRFIVDVAGPDLLASRRIRYLLALHASEAQLDDLHDFAGAAKSRGVTQESLSRCVADRTWHPGKRWPRHFVAVLGLPPALAGFAGAPGGPDFEDVEPHLPLPPLEDFQEDLRVQVTELLGAAAGSNRAVLTLPTGSGKTRTTVEALIDWWLNPHKGEFIFWVAQSDELCEQAVQAFREVWIDRGDRGVRDTLRIHRFWGGRRTVPDEDDAGVIVSTIDKLRKVLLDPEESTSRASLLRIARLLGAVVIDEAHRAEAPSYRKVLAAIGIDFTPDGRADVPVVGLTATPLRSQHEETERLARRFYNRLLRPRNLPEDPADALDTLRERFVLSRPTHRILPASGPPLRMTPDQEKHFEMWNELHPEVLTNLGERRDRNQHILAAILELDASWPVLFFGCSVQHAEAMAVLLRRRGRESVAITAETREATRRHHVEAFRAGQLHVLCNYGVLTAGFDAPRVRAVVIGRPTASRVLYEQMIGRGMRGPRFGGTDECLVIDVEDNLVHRDGSQFTTASRQYVEYWVNAEREGT